MAAAAAPALAPIARGSARFGLYGWGRFDFSLLQDVLGLGGTATDLHAPRTASNPALATAVHPPTLLAAFDNDLVYLRAGVKHAGIVTQSTRSGTHRIVLAGLNTSGQLGILPDSNDHPAGAWSRHVWSLPDKSVVHCIALGRQHSLALIQDGTGSRTVWTAGSNHFGQSLLSAPSLINAWSAPDLPLGDVVHVAAGYDHSVFLHASGTVSSAGWASDGQTGHAATGVYGSWARLQQLGGNEGPGSAVRRIVAGADHTLAITADQRPGDGVRGCYAWGNSEYGQCATGRAVDRIAAPVPATVPWTRAHPERAHPTSADAYAFPGSSDVALVDAAAGASASLFAVACTPPFSSATWWARRSPVTAGTAALAPPPRGPSPAGIDRRLVYAGHGVSEGAAVPLPASVPADGEWALVSARGHAVGLHTTRRVFTANGASLAACAHGSGVASDPWRRVFHVLDAGERITAVALGVDFGLAVTELS